MENLTRDEKRLARLLGVSFQDLHRVGSNTMGAVWGLYNPFCLCEMTFNGYTQREIYRILLRKLLSRCGYVA